MNASILLAVTLLGQLSEPILKDAVVNPPAVASTAALVWNKLPALPDPEGFGGMYAGTSDDAFARRKPGTD